MMPPGLSVHEPLKGEREGATGIEAVFFYWMIGLEAYQQASVDYRVLWNFVD